MSYYDMAVEAFEAHKLEMQELGSTYSELEKATWINGYVNGAIDQDRKVLEAMK
jgi:hypothetical protein